MHTQEDKTRSEGASDRCQVSHVGVLAGGGRKYNRKLYNDSELEACETNERAPRLTPPHRRWQHYLQPRWLTDLSITSIKQVCLKRYHWAPGHNQVGDSACNCSVYICVFFCHLLPQKNKGNHVLFGVNIIPLGLECGDVQIQGYAG